MRVPWTARRSNQSILKEISLRCSLEGLMLKLNLQSFGRLMRRADPLERTLMLGGVEAGGGGDDEDGMAGCITDSMDVRVGLYRKLSNEELMLLNYGVGEDS